MTQCPTNEFLICVNNANKIEIVRAFDFLSVYQINNITLPRYAVVDSEGRYVYVSTWGSNGLDGSIEKIDLSDYSIVNTIPTGSGPEHLVIKDNILYVVNSGGFGRDSTVVFIDLPAFVEVSRTVVGDNPNSLVFDSNESLWTLGSGYTDWNDPGNNRPALLCRIHPSGQKDCYTVPNGASRLNYGSTHNTLYFLADNKIFKAKLSHNTNDPPVISVLNTNSFYSLNINPQTGILYAGDAKDFPKQWFYSFNRLRRR